MLVLVRFLYWFVFFSVFISRQHNNQVIVVIGRPLIRNFATFGEFPGDSVLSVPCVGPLWVGFWGARVAAGCSPSILLFAWVHRQIRNIRGRDNIAASDIGSAPAPSPDEHTINTTWINNERCRTTSQRGPSSSRPFKSITGSLLAGIMSPDAERLVSHLDFFSPVHLTSGS